jgi:Mg2+ and Co2+ transporter CorA
MISMFLAFGAVITGMFGMNITNRYEDHYSWFIGIGIMVGVIFIIGNAGLYLYFSHKGIWVS